MCEVKIGVLLDDFMNVVELMVILIDFKSERVGGNGFEIIEERGNMIKGLSGRVLCGF